MKILRREGNVRDPRSGGTDIVLDALDLQVAIDDYIAKSGGIVRGDRVIHFTVGGRQKISGVGVVVYVDPPGEVL